MYRCLASFICIILSVILFIDTVAYADHPPKKLMRNFKAYGQLGETGKLGPFSVNVAKFGSLPDLPITSSPDDVYTTFLSDKFNLASIVMKNGHIVHEAYNAKQNINSNTPLLGMSMSKTAAAASVGSLICDGEIKSIDDKVGAYSSFLDDTAFADVTLRNVLQMNSGVSPLGRTDEDDFNKKARGMERFEGKASQTSKRC